MFSATFQEDVQHLAGKFLNNYVFVTIGIVGGACSDVEQVFYQVDKFDKRTKLFEILKEVGKFHDNAQFCGFTNIVPDCTFSFDD